MWATSYRILCAILRIAVDGVAYNASLWATHHIATERAALPAGP